MEDITAEINDRVPGWSYSLQVLCGVWMCRALKDKYSPSAVVWGNGEGPAAVLAAVNRRIREVNDGR